MAQEIERKFKLGDPAILQGLRGALLEQGYVAQGAATVRVRIINEHAWLTLKGPAQNGARLELEYPIPLQDAQELLALKGATALSKTRFRIEHGGFVYEVDQYHGHLDGLFSVEVELPSIQTHLDLPDWVGDEVTGQRAWDNDMLAREGRPR